MRRFSYAACLLVLLAPCAALAAADVLLPSSSGNSSSLPNLGLGASSSAPAASTPAPVAPAQPAPPPAETPAPTPDAAQISTPPVTITPLKGDTSHLPLGTIPTQIINLPDNSAMLAQAYGKLPYALTIGIGSQSIFGAKDIKTIGDKLGLSREDIPSHCILTVRGLLQTDKGGYVIDGGASPQLVARYDGMIQNFLISGHALCTAGQLPMGSGFITETGGRYDVGLQPITCPAPKRQAARLTITYTGDDHSQCSYE
ncbi:MAG: hypothetical protein P4M15_11510 [Alphaproteobacteria bacterium]|nr:hypothetical protein [Alphaproteobacteria bacterium]